MPDGAPPPLPDHRLIGAMAARYAGASRFTRGYVGSKLRRDPSTAAILALAGRAGGLGHVADLGCGRGQLALALLLSGAAARVTGLDYEEAKVAEARAAGAGLAADFRRADLTVAAVRPMPVADVAARLAGAGFRSEVAPCWAGTPLPNVLLVAERAS